MALLRGLFRRGVEPRIVARSARLAETGLLSLALALSGAVLLLMDIVLGCTAAIVITAAAIALFVGLWPWVMRCR